jgi:gamma-glutamyltranspeptidase/glutathione hydrolase
MCSVLVVVATVLAIAWVAESADVDLSPDSWPAGDLEFYSRLNHQYGLQNVLAEGTNGVVTGTTGAMAQRAGLEALIQGGSAADAVIATSLAQIALAMGSWVSYAGIFTMVYYDAANDSCYSLNGGYNTVLGEDDPMSIPVQEEVAAGEPNPSGRTALVPGFMAGVEAAHERFGKLPFAALFAPAIHIAENGYVLTQNDATRIVLRHKVLDRLPETRAVFTKPDGSWYTTGDLFTQPALAKTLRAVAEQGAGYMYTGTWAQKMVAAVRADGGRMTLEDLASYEAIWSEPIRISYGDHEIHAPALPAQGGAQIAEVLHLAARAGLTDMGHYSESPEAFFWLAQMTNLFGLSFIPETMVSAMLSGADGSLAARLTPEHADRLWKMMSEGKFPLTGLPASKDPKHSDAVVAIDRWGNVAAVVHTINTSSWGTTGIFVDGVSIPDSAVFQQALIARTGPGRRLPDPTEPLIVARDGQPVAALASIGAGLHQKTVATLLNLIDFGMDIKAAVDEPSMHIPAYGSTGIGAQQVFEGDFCNHLLSDVRELGLGVIEVPNTWQTRAPRGYVIGASIDAEGVRRGVATDTANGRALAY